MKNAAYDWWFPILTLCLVMLVAGKVGVPLANQATDCDFQFISSQAKTGTFRSPNYPNPYPNGVHCKYSFQAEGKERVQITFNDMDLHYPAGDPLDPFDCSDVDNVLVETLINGKDGEIGDYCGKKKPPTLMSSGNNMHVFFTSRSESMAKGFNATYKFVGDFGIKTGVQDKQQVCGFEYRSLTALNGTFTSPNYPGLYPRETECHYLFYGQGKTMKVEITFLTFSVEGISPKCDEDTQSDYVEFSNFNIELKDRKMSRLCGTQLSEQDKRVESDANFFRVTFKSNDLYDEMGFEARYRFVVNTEDQVISTDKFKETKSGSPALHPTIPVLFIFITAAIWNTGYRTFSCL